MAQQHPIIVDKDDYAVFMAILRRGKQDKLSIQFERFEKAMVAAGFAVVPRKGTAKEFIPPFKAASVTVSRDHGKKSREMSKKKILRVKTKLEKTYDWHPETFATAYSRRGIAA